MILYLKKRIFYVNCRRPSTAGQRRPVTAPEPRPRPDNSIGVPVGRSVQANKQIVHVPGEDNLDSGLSNSPNNLKEKDVEQPVPAPLRKPGHARKPSDGANKELPPIAEHAKQGEEKKKLTSSSGSSENDTLVEVHTIKEVHVYTFQWQQ